MSNRPDSEAFARFAAGCPYRLELPVPPRRANALNVEAGMPAPRCTLKTPEHWPSGSSALRWLASGGSALVLGTCSRACALGQRWCSGCGHRAESHVGGVCRVTAAGNRFPCGCESEAA